MTTKIQKWGNSLAVRIPREIINRFRLQAGSEVAIREDRSHITIVRVPGRDRVLPKVAWRTFLIPTKKKKEKVSGKIDNLLYGLRS